MVKKFVFGDPIETYAIVKDCSEQIMVGSQAAADQIPHFAVKTEDTSEFYGTKGIRFTLRLAPDDIVYGLGETMKGINKRGGRYVSYNTDEPNHTDDMLSLYGSHNFVIIAPKVKEGEQAANIGAFFDTPSRTSFLVDYETSGKLDVFAESDSVRLYIFEGDTPYDIVKEFRQMIGQSFIPPLWAFGFCQSRWGYKDEKDVRDVVKGYRNAGIPLDSVCMDIDYMDRFIDFTINNKRFPDLKGFSQEMKNEGIHLVPIIDAGVKVEPGNEVYEEGVANNYFCTNAKGKPFKAAVWPGMTHFPDFFQPGARKWFGSKYKVLTDCGIEGFWNDMNEPAVFYSEITPKINIFDTVLSAISKSFAEKKAAKGSNAYQAYKHFYHNINGKKVLHHDVHNLYGGFMTMADCEGLEELLDHRFLLYSRASYIGAHRYGGIWTGDNASVWNHLRRNVCQMPSLNMCGFVYSGADTGGFGGNATRELLLRWLAFSDFTPLMRDHSCMGTRKQECYNFDDTEAFRRVVNLRYRLIPYIYSEFMKAVLKGEMYMRPLAFDFPADTEAVKIEDQLMVGDCIMVAPVIEKGVTGRNVYLPERMTLVRFDGTDFTCTKTGAGRLWIDVAANEVVFFIRDGKSVPVANKQVQSTKDLDITDVHLIGDVAPYEQYVDDGLTRTVTLENIRVIG